MNPQATRRIKEPLTMEAAVLEAAEMLSQQEDLARNAEQAISYMMFFDSLEKEFQSR